VSDEDGVDQDEEDEEAEAIDLVTLPYHFLSSLLTVGQRKQVFVPDNNLHTSLKLFCPPSVKRKEVFYKIDARSQFPERRRFIVVNVDVTG